MLVKAKWNVKDSSGWHRAGEVFDTKEELGEAVELLEAPRRQKTEPKEEVPVKEPEKAPEQKKTETGKAPARQTQRRKNSK